MRRRVARGSVVGLDLSLRGPAACAIPNDWDMGWKAVRTTRFSPPEVASCETMSEAFWRSRYERLAWIVGCVEGFILAHEATHVFVEDYAYSASSSAVTMLAELGGAVRVHLFDRMGKVAVPIPASEARKYLLGSAKVVPKMKQLAFEAILQMGASFETEDECDAFVIANYGRTTFDLPGLAVPR